MYEMTDKEKLEAVKEFFEDDSKKILLYDSHFNSIFYFLPDGYDIEDGKLYITINNVRKLSFNLFLICQK